MIRDEIVKLAREAGIDAYPDHLRSYESESVRISFVERFAALVAAAEREACAKICEVNGVVKNGEIFAARIRTWRR